MLNIVEKKKIWLTLSTIMVAAGLILILGFGFRQGIDFAGGTLWQINFENSVETGQVRELFINSGLEGVAVTKSGDGSLLVRMGDINENKHQELVRVLTHDLGQLEELSFQSIGPTVGKELREKAIWAAILVLLGISLFVAFAFRKVSQPVSSWKYGIVTLVTLAHDVIIAAGAIALLGKYYGVEIDSNMVVALLVIAGFSVHDTIVVFDRIRENLIIHKGKMLLGKIVNQSVNETMARSINTSLTLVFVLIALLAAGPASLWYFILVVLIGTVVGTYSSIFIASQLLVVWQEWAKGK